MSKYVGFRLGKVHESHVISEYYCGGCGYPVTDHDSFCPECGGAFRESDASDLEVENAKLRELVRIAVKYCDSGTCDGCPIQGESGSCPYSDMARELGVEAPDGD